MRGLPGFLLLAVAAVAILALVVVPLVVRPLVTSGVQNASPFGDEPLRVDVDVNALSLVLGSIDGVHVSGRDLARDDGVAVGAIDLQLSRVSTSDQSFGDIDGTLTNVDVPWLEGDPVTIDEIELSGPSTELHATIRLGQPGAVDFMTNTFLDAGVTVEGIGLTDGGLTVTVFGAQGFLLIGAEDGALVIPELLGGGPFTILAPGPDDRWRITGVTTTADAMVIDAVLDAEAMLGAR